MGFMGVPPAAVRSLYPEINDHGNATEKGEALLHSDELHGTPFSAASPLSFISGYSDHTIAGGTLINPTTPRQGRQGKARQAPATAPASLQTTLYDVIAVLQSDVEPNADDLVVEIVAHWLRTGRITLVRDATVAA